MLIFLLYKFYHPSKATQMIWYSISVVILQWSFLTCIFPMWSYFDVYIQKTPNFSIIHHLHTISFSNRSLKKKVENGRCETTSRSRSVNSYGYTICCAHTLLIVIWKVLHYFCFFSFIKMYLYCSLNIKKSHTHACTCVCTYTHKCIFSFNWYGPAK